MKKFLIMVAIFVAVSTTTANGSNFGKGFPKFPKVENLFKRIKKQQEFYNICREIIEIHKDFPQFREVLPKRLLRKADIGFYSLDEAIEIILVWLDDFDCYDILVEWPAMDDFFEMYENY